MKKHIQNVINLRNKKAYFDYEILDKFEAGLQLTGTEIKSIRQGKASLADSFCKFFANELWALFHIAEYSHGGYVNHLPKRERKLLLTHRELRLLRNSVATKGLTIVPLRLYINKQGWAKLEIALARGKKTHDKRDAIREKDDKRAIDRAMKE